MYALYLSTTCNFRTCVVLHKADEHSIIYFPRCARVIIAHNSLLFTYNATLVDLQLVPFAL